MKEKVIKVKEENQNKLYSINHALKLCYKIDKALLSNYDKIIIDFTDIKLLTLIFFEFSLGYYINKFGEEEFNNKFKIIGLNESGLDLYNNVYNNCIKKNGKSHEKEK